LRIGEVLKLDRSQIAEVDSQLVITIPKKVNRSQQYVPVTKRLKAILDTLPAEGKLFRWDNSSRSYLNRRFNEILQRAGISGKTGFHVLRKTFRHRLRKAGVSLDDSMKLMRHSNVKVTQQHYTLYEAAELGKVLDGMEKLKGKKAK
jgi:integrase